MDPQQPQYRPQPHQGPAVPPASMPAAPSSPQSTPSPEASYGQPAYGDPNQGQPKHDFSFIMEPANPFKTKKGKPTSGGSNKLGRIVIVGGMVVVLLIAYAIVKSVLASSGSVNTAQLLAVAQDQQELVHLTAGISNKQGLADTTLNSAWTINISVTNSENNLLKYLKDNKYKTTTKLLTTKETPATDTQLTTSYTNGTYDATYITVIQDQLTTYSQDLKAAYQGNHGTNGRAMLNDDYKAAQLLLVQLNSPAS